MAHKIDPPTAEVPVAAADPDAEALGILHPERQFQLAGRVITVREYGHIEGLRLLSWARPFFDGLYALMPVDGGAPPSLTAFSQLQADHADLVLAMISKSIDQEPAFIESLNDRDGDLLVTVWWEVNKDFFIRRLLARAAGEKLTARLLAGYASTTHSSAPGLGEHRTR